MESIMMDKKPHVKPYLYGMLAGFGAISLSIIFFFLIYRFDGFGDAISTLTGILMPFIYGAVIAYLLKPVCNTIESFLRRFIPEKMHGLVNMLSITLTILFGLLLILHDNDLIPAHKKPQLHRLGRLQIGMPQ